MNSLRGTGVAIITPFNKDLSIDFDALKKLTRFQINKGVNYIVIMGTTGENPTISDEEQRLVIKTIKEENNDEIPLVLGIGGNNTPLLVNRVQDEILLDGMTAILSVSPYYSKPTQQGIINHFTAIANVAKKPVLLYNVPGRTGMNMVSRTTLALAKHPNIIGIKEASGDFDQVMELVQGRPKDFLIISGDDSYTFPFICLGMDGVISVIGQAYPSEFSNMVNFALKGELDKAKEIHYLLYNMMNNIFMDGNPGGVKYILHKMGMLNNIVRPPLAPIGQEVAQIIDSAMLKI